MNVASPRSQPLGIRSRRSKCFFINSHLNDFSFSLPFSLSLSLTTIQPPDEYILRLNKASLPRAPLFENDGEESRRRSLVGNYLPSGNKLKAKQRVRRPTGGKMKRKRGGSAAPSDWLARTGRRGREDGAQLFDLISRSGVLFLLVARCRACPRRGWLLLFPRFPSAIGKIHPSAWIANGDVWNRL